MALSFGWRANDLRESIWKDDPALVGVPAGALDAWTEDGDASHLLPFATAGQPTIINFRALTPDEKPIVTAPMTDSDGNGERLAGFSRSLILAFRIGVSFEGADESMGPDPETGAKRRIVAKERGIRMLAPEIVADLDAVYPGLVQFYGNLIFQASFLTETEKKASSPPSTPTPSSEVASTAGTTEPSPPAEAVTVAP
jgi:hypothetical protein